MGEVEKKEEEGKKEVALERDERIMEGMQKREETEEMGKKEEKGRKEVVTERDE